MDTVPRQRDRLACPRPAGAPRPVAASSCCGGRSPCCCGAWSWRCAGAAAAAAGPATRLPGWWARRPRRPSCCRRTSCRARWAAAAAAAAAAVAARPRNRGGRRAVAAHGGRLAGCHRGRRLDRLLGRQALTEPLGDLVHQLCGRNGRALDDNVAHGEDGSAGQLDHLGRLRLGRDGAVQADALADPVEITAVFEAI